MGRRRKYVPKPDDPVHDVFTMDDFILFMNAYWRWIWCEWKRTIRGRITLGALVIVLLDYIRIYLFKFLI